PFYYLIFRWYYAASTAFTNKIKDSIYFLKIIRPFFIIFYGFQKKIKSGGKISARAAGYGRRESYG
ncbi:hypothetical protein, partial [uncultured Alistipes sp.]|uniref:hypothetical protein n=1 Tax=uncultured Alistipes sp. TaxID=538949 RepID=UPI0026DFA1C3